MCWIIHTGLWFTPYKPLAHFCETALHYLHASTHVLPFLSNLRISLRARLLPAFFVLSQIKHSDQSQWNTAHILPICSGKPSQGVCQVYEFLLNTCIWWHICSTSGQLIQTRLWTVWVTLPHTWLYQHTACLAEVVVFLASGMHVFIRSTPLAVIHTVSCYPLSYLFSIGCHLFLQTCPNPVKTILLFHLLFHWNHNFLISSVSDLAPSSVDPCKSSKCT